MNQISRYIRHIAGILSNQRRSFEIGQRPVALSIGKWQILTHQGRWNVDSHWKPAVDFLLVLVELFPKVLRLRVTSEYRFKIGDFAPTGTGWSKILSWRGPHQPFFFSDDLNDLSYGIKIWTDFSSFLSQFTRLTDRQTE